MIRVTAFKAIIAGGGTGGHLFPGIAVAGELEKRFDQAEVLFVVGHRKMEGEILSRYGYKQRSIDIEGIKGRGWKKGLYAMFKIPKSLFQSIRLLREFSPHVVLGMGGYSAGPVCLAARLMGIPTAIHEQNSYPGLTNRLLSRLVNRVFISFEQSGAHLPAGCVLTGNPVREEILAGRVERPSSFTLLVVGGSLGARAVNDAFVEALDLLKKEGRTVHVIHQTGEADHERIIERYAALGLEGEISAFINDMAGAYARASLVIGRAGATTIFELAALSMPSILIPYPYAANRHQDTNALSLSEAGGAETVKQESLDPRMLARLIGKYMDDPDSLRRMGENAGRMIKGKAQAVIADQIIELIEEKGKGRIM